MDLLHSDDSQTNGDISEAGMNESSKELLPKMIHNNTDVHGSGDSALWIKSSNPTGSSTAYLTDDSGDSVSPFSKKGGSGGGYNSKISNGRKYASVVILFLINLLNYMDRFTIAGVLVQIQQFFNISDSEAGLLQTIFVCSYMVAAPIFGYLGDRYNRKVIMIFGILVWSGATLGASFVTNPDFYWVFMIFRALVGIGEASYSTIAPTLIADMFEEEKRTPMYSLFFFAIPVGSGLGFVTGSAAASYFGSWEWALRVTPVLSVVVIFLMIFVIPTVKRGGADAVKPDVLEKLDAESEEKESYCNDLKHIFKNKTFMCITIGFTFMAFMAGSLSFWGPKLVAYSQVTVGALEPCTSNNCEYSSISFIFGVIICLSGFGGVILGTGISKVWKKTRKNADALLCGIGLLLAGPLMLAAFEITTYNLSISWLCIFLSNLFMCFTWTPSTDMTMYITMPSRRATANAVQILILHLFGDAGSPYIVGVISDYLRVGKPDTFATKFYALKYACYITPFACVIGGMFYLIGSLFLVADRKKVDDVLKGKSDSTIKLEIEMNEYEPVVSRESVC